MTFFKKLLASIAALSVLFFFSPSLVFASTINIGSTATPIAGFNGSNFTVIIGAGPATGSGTITTINLQYSITGTGVVVGTFFGSGTTWTNRASVSLGTVTSGSLQTFNGLNLPVQSGDLIGVFSTAGSLNVGSGVPLYYYKSGNQFGTGVQTYTQNSGSGNSFILNGTGSTAAVVTPSILGLVRAFWLN